MTTGIEAEMARFEEEVLGNESKTGRARTGGGMPDLQPPPFMRGMGHGNFDSGPMPGHPMMSNDMMMGPGPMMGGAMMGHDLGGPHMLALQPKVYSAAPQITKRKNENDESDAIPAKVAAGDSSSMSSSTAESSLSGILGVPGSLVNTFISPRIQKTNTGSGSHPPSAFSQATAASGYDSAKLLRKKKFLRTAAGQTWEDPTLQEWDPSDYRIFCGDLGNEVTDDVLARVFNKYTSFQKAKVVRDKHSKKSKGYGFVSFKDPNDFIRAMREMNGKYVGNRPIKLRKSNWKDRNIDVVRKKLKEKKKLGYKV